jgi:hypothetical protein
MLLLRSPEAIRRQLEHALGGYVEDREEVELVQCGEESSRL